MEVTDFTLRVLLLFTPGIVAVLLESRNTHTIEKSTVIFFMRAFLYGAFSYCVLSIIYSLLNGIISIVSNNCIEGNNIHINYLNVKFFSLINDSNEKIDFIETFWVSIIAIVISCLKSAYDNIVRSQNYLLAKGGNSTGFEKIILKIHEFFKKIKVSKVGAGNADVWNYLFANLNNLITVRDWDNSLSYVGVLKLSSENHNNAELYLENVTIVNMKDTNNVREVDAVYLCKENCSSWDIELLYRDSEEGGDVE